MIIIENTNYLREIYRMKSINRFVESLILELVGRNDKLKRWQDYVDNFDNSVDYSEYKTDPSLIEVKGDLADMFSTLQNKLKDVNKVQNVSYKPSPQTGLSNYIKVYFDKPKDANYLKQYRNFYYMEIKVSDHFQSGKGTDNINLVGMTFNQIEKDILTIVKDRANWLNQKEKNWKNKIGKNRSGRRR